MAINRDPAEWFHSPNSMSDVVYGILKTTDEWLVLKKKHDDFAPFGVKPDVEVIARAPTREGAIGFLKLLKE